MCILLQTAHNLNSMHKPVHFFIQLFTFLALPVYRQRTGSSPSAVLSERDRSRVVDEILEDRFTNLLPQLMRREGLDMWVIISREYNEDPVLRTMLPSTWLSARRRTIIVFFDQGGDKGC